jgi:hypothetical protein
LGVEGGAAESFHVDQDRGVRVENGDGVGDEIVDVVGFPAGEVPIVADPRERFGIANVEGVAEQGRTGNSGVD